MQTPANHRLNRHLYLAQRISAMLLAPLVLAHLALILYAIGDGLSAEEILSRTRGSMLWAIFYSVFVFAAAVHAPIGMRNVLLEWTSINARTVDRLVLLLAVILLVTGMRAVIAVT